MSESDGPRRKSERARQGRRGGPRGVWARPQEAVGEGRAAVRLRRTKRPGVFDGKKPLVARTSGGSRKPQQVAGAIRHARAGVGLSAHRSTTSLSGAPGGCPSQASPKARRRRTRAMSGRPEHVRRRWRSQTSASVPMSPVVDDLADRGEHGARIEGTRSRTCGPGGDRFPRLVFSVGRARPEIFMRIRLPAQRGVRAAQLLKLAIVGRRMRREG